MMALTPKVALIIFLVILCLSMFLGGFYQNYDDFNIGKFHTFVVILAGLGVIVTFMFYYGVVTLQQQQQRLFVVQETARLSDTISNGLLVEIDKAAEVIPNFALSLTPLSGCPPVLVPDPETPVACTQRQVLSYKVFSIWQDLIIGNSFIEYDPEAYVTNFLQRANSKQLLEQWKLQKINFNHKTQDFGDLLFEYAIPIEIQKPESYVSAAHALLADPRYQDVLKS
jgi:hypothetical protein